MAVPVGILLHNVTHSRPAKFRQHERLSRMLQRVRPFNWRKKGMNAILSAVSIPFGPKKKTSHASSKYFFSFAINHLPGSDSFSSLTPVVSSDRKRSCAIAVLAANRSARTRSTPYV